MIYYQPTYFRLEEIVSKQAFENYKNRQHILWQQFDPRALYSADQLKLWFRPKEPVYINTWLWNGIRQFSGLRLPDDNHYSITSQHTHGRGFDITWPGIDTQEIRDFLIRNPQFHKFRYITCIESDTPTWVHFDTRNWDKEAHGILQVPYR